MPVAPEEKNKRYLRQVIVCRKDLNMPTGKVAAMCAHAAMTFIIKKLSLTGFSHLDGEEDAWCFAHCNGLFTEDEWQWITELDPGLEKEGQVSMAKIVLEVKSIEELLEVEKKTKEANLMVVRVVDSGYSHNPVGTLTCIAIGPDWPEKLQPITGHLKLYR